LFQHRVAYAWISFLWALAKFFGLIVRNMERGGETMDSTGGLLMPNPEEYRQYAKLCADLAKISNDKIERGTLLQIANQWRRLANHRVKRERRKDPELLTAAS
jgi:hypothetical protein